GFAQHVPLPPEVVAHGGHAEPGRLAGVQGDGELLRVEVAPFGHGVLDRLVGADVYQVVADVLPQPRVNGDGGQDAFADLLELVAPEPRLHDVSPFYGRQANEPYALGCLGSEVVADQVRNDPGRVPARSGASPGTHRRKAGQD